jgi:hypothetical protein
MRQGSISLGESAILFLIDAFPKAELVAVGKKAGLLLKKMAIVLAAVVRHPANGGPLTSLSCNSCHDMAFILLVVSVPRRGIYARSGA